MTVASNLVFAVALMLETGIVPANNPRATSTVVFVAPAAYEDSITCQRMAAAFNKARGSHFRGHDTGPYKGADGIVMGAWCVVAPNQQTKETK